MLWTATSNPSLLDRPRTAVQESFDGVGDVGRCVNARYPWRREIASGGRGEVTRDQHPKGIPPRDEILNVVTDSGPQ